MFRLSFMVVKAALLCLRSSRPVNKEAIDIVEDFTLACSEVWLLKWCKIQHCEILFTFNIYSFIFTICLFTFNICLFIFSICLFIFNICFWHSTFVYSHSAFVYSYSAFVYSYSAFVYLHSTFVYSHSTFVFSYSAFVYSCSTFVYSHSTFVCIQYQYLFKFNIYAHYITFTFNNYIHSKCNIYILFLISSIQRFLSIQQLFIHSRFTVHLSYAWK